jgi:hypothetical protein
MGVETATYISQLSATNPLGTDPVSEGDNQIRLVKEVLQAQFPNFTAATVDPTVTELNYVDGVTSAIQTQIDSKSATTGNASIATVGTVTTGVWQGTDVGTAHGGTGSSTTSGARTNLGVAIGSDVQAYDADTAKLDVDQSWSGSQRGTPQTITQGTLIDLDTGNNFLYTPAAADELSFTNETTGQSGFIKLINPSGYTISLGSEVKAVSTFATDVTVAGTYLVTYFSDGTNVYVSASAALV